MDIGRAVSKNCTPELWGWLKPSTKGEAQLNGRALLWPECEGWEQARVGTTDVSNLKLLTYINLPRIVNPSLCIIQKKHGESQVVSKAGAAP